jgi:hypothetical protein
LAALNRASYEPGCSQLLELSLQGADRSTCQASDLS